MNSPTRILMMVSGALGRRCASLLADLPSLALTLADPDASLPDLDGHQLVALVTQRPFPAVAAALDQACWSAAIPWLHAQLCGHRFRVGPVIVPPSTPCWECLRRRLSSLAPDLPAHEAVEAAAMSGSSDPWFRGELGPLTTQVAALTAAQIVALATRTAPTSLASASPSDMGQFWEGDAIFGLLRGRRFARIGRCPRCSPMRADDSVRFVAEQLGRRFVHAAPDRGAPS